MARKKATAESRLKAALAALDTAVQRWYEEYAPDNKERYASVHIRTYPDGTHASTITVQPDEYGNEYLDLRSSKDSD